MVRLPTFTTDMTHALNLEIAKKSHGVAFLMFSRGKDSLAAWLNMKRYFTRIIPFHCASYPGLKHVKSALDYYERIMETKIIRLVGEEVPLALARAMYQTMDDLEELEELETQEFSKLDIVEQLRHDFNLPRTWCAVGLSMYDSIDRRIYIQKTGGKNKRNLTWYPNADWPRAEIIRTVKESGVKLSGEYRWACRTLGGVPSSTVNRILRDHYPEDWERVQAIYPLALAKSIREKYLDIAWEKRKEAGIVEDDSQGDAEAEESAADIMPEIENV